MPDNIKKIKDFVKNKKVSVLGLGISNLPLLKILCEADCDITVRDRNEIGGEAKELSKKYNINVITGADYLKNISEDIAFRSPGIMSTLPELLEAEKNGCTVTSEMELFFELCPAKIIGITGSDGKTTTTTVISELLKAEGKKVFLGGNIGSPLLHRLNEMTKEDFAVAELSSFQLMSMKKSPEIAVITNISPNHLDKHKDYDEYINAKKNIMKNQNATDILVVNADNEITEKIGREARGVLRSFSSQKTASVYLKDGSIFYENEEILKTEDIKIPGHHNIENYMAAIAALHGLVKKESIIKVAKSFGGVAHRIELVRELENVKYYNSSIDSSPNRTKNTLSVFRDKVIMIAGGKDKGIPYDEIGPVIVKKVRVLILIGDTADVIENAVKKAGGDAVEIIRAKSYKNAVELAKDRAKSGECVVLSPASTSFDMFKNFEERGNLFKALVNEL